MIARAAEKVLGVRSTWAEENPDLLRRLVRAHRRAAAFIEDVGNRDGVAALLAAPHRIGVSAEVIRRTLDGRMNLELNSDPPLPTVSIIGLVKLLLLASWTW